LKDAESASSLLIVVFACVEAIWKVFKFDVFWENVGGIAQPLLASLSECELTDKQSARVTAFSDLLTAVLCTESGSISR
jgi:hypothetical protein